MPFRKLARNLNLNFLVRKLSSFNYLIVDKYANTVVKKHYYRFTHLRKGCQLRRRRHKLSGMTVS